MNFLNFVKFANFKTYSHEFSIYLANTAIGSDCQTPSGQIPRDEPVQAIDGYGSMEGKTLRKGGF